MAEETTTKQAAKPAPAAPQAATGIGIAALIVGIVGFLSGLLPVWGFLVGATAVVLSIIALKKSAGNKGFGITGLILGGIAVVTNLIVTVFWILAFTLTAVGTGTALDVSKTLNDTLSAQDKLAQSQIDAKKDFAAGEKARFGEFEVKVNSVNKNFVPSSVYSQADSGSKYVLVNITVTNPSDEGVSISSYDFKLNADGVANKTSYVSIDDEFQGGTLEKGASTSGNLVFTVKEDAKELKLQFETQVFTPKTYKLAELTYTLGL
jgi:hypothetical protein